MVDPRLVERKLAALRARVDRVRKHSAIPRDRFVVDADAHELVAFNLFLAFQEALDLAAHIIADQGWDVPATAREHFSTLAQRGVIAPALAADLAACAGARNRIAHAYGGVDPGRLYDELPAGLSALERFAATLASARGTAHST